MIGLKKGICIFVCILVIFTASSGIVGSKHVSNSIINSSLSQTSNIIYVDDDNINGPWCGSEENPYKFIKDAVENATDGNVIHVFSGYYKERNIKVNKQLVFRGIKSNGTKPIVDGNNSGTIFKISADNCKIENFTIIRPGYSLSAYGRNIKSGADGTVIINNEIQGPSEMGIDLTTNSKNARIINNTFTNMQAYGIYVFSSHNANISYNRISGKNANGIFVRSRYCTLYRNTIDKCKEGCVLYFGGNHKVIENTISNNSHWGFILYVNCWVSELIGNTISNNGGKGLFINSGQVPTIIKNNKIYSNDNVGLEISYTDNVSVIGNDIKSNNGNGIYIEMSKNPLIKYNNIEKNEKRGLFSVATEGLTAFNNNFIENSLNAEDLGIKSTWDKGDEIGGNYWSDYDGIDLNGDGIGEKYYNVKVGKIDHYPLIRPYSWENVPPEKPKMIGPTNGAVGEEIVYSFSSIDQNGDDVSFLIDWDDGKKTGWTEYVPSGSEIKISHTWKVRGTHIVKVKSKDIYGKESELTIQEVAIPRAKQRTINELIRLIFRL